MNLEKLIPYGIIALLLLSLAVLGNAYLKKRDAYVSLQSEVLTLQAAAKDAVEKEKAKGEKILQQVRENNEKDLDAAVKLALRNYARMRGQPVKTSTCPIATSPSQQVDDDAQREPVVDPVTTRIVQAAAEDVRKINAWIEYCTRNNCPVED